MTAAVRPVLHHGVAVGAHHDASQPRSRRWTPVVAGRRGIGHVHSSRRAALAEAREIVDRSCLPAVLQGLREHQTAPLLRDIVSSHLSDVRDPTTDDGFSIASDETLASLASGVWPFVIGGVAGTYVGFNTVTFDGQPDIRVRGCRWVDEDDHPTGEPPAAALAGIAAVFDAANWSAQATAWLRTRHPLGYLPEPA